MNAIESTLQSLKEVSLSMNFVIENHIQAVPEEADFLLEVARLNQQIFQVLQDRSDAHNAAKVKAAEIAKSLASISARMARNEKTED